MPTTTRSGRTTTSVAPRPTRRTTKIALRKRRAASDDEGDSKYCIVVHGSSSEFESKSAIEIDSDSDSDNFVPSPKPAPKKKVIPTRAKAATAKPGTSKKVPTPPPAADIHPSTSTSTLKLTHPLTTDPLVTHIAINDLLPFINRPAATRLEEQAANPKTAGKALNAFFVYKMAYHNRIRALQNHLNSKIPKNLWFQNNYNKVAAQSWKLEDQAVRDFYSELSHQDEINRAKAFKDCREMIRVKRTKGAGASTSKAGRRWAKVLKSEQQKALPVGVVPGRDFTAEDAVREQQNQSVAVERPVRSPLDIEMSLGSPSLVLPPPTPGLAEALFSDPVFDDSADALFDYDPGPIVDEAPAPIIEDTVMKSPGLPKPATDEEARERTLEILRRAFYLAAKDLEKEKQKEKAKEKAKETTIEEDMSHLALDDHEREDHEDMSHFALEEHEREHEEMCELGLEIHEREQEDMSHFALDDSEEEHEEESERTASPEPEPRDETISFTEYLNQDLEQVG